MRRTSRTLPCALGCFASIPEVKALARTALGRGFITAHIALIFAIPPYSERYGRLAQLDRALASGAKGRAFESRIAHHLIARASAVFG